LAAVDDLPDLAERGRWGELRDRAGVRVAADAEDDGARYWLGRASYELALELLGSSSPVSRDLGHAQLARAIVQLALVDERTGDATDAVDWWLHARFVDHRYWADLAESERPWDDGSELVATFERVWNERGRAAAAYLRGRVALEREEEDALVWLERAARADPGRGEHQLLWANALAQRGRRDEALDAWWSAAASDAGTPELLGCLAAILPGTSDAAERLRVLDELLASGRRTLDAWIAWYRGWALDELDRAEAAEAAFAAATSGRPSGMDRAHAGVLYRLGRLDEAVALLLPRAEEGDWSAFSMLIDVAEALALERRWEEALSTYDRVLAIEGRDERAVHSRAITLWRAGRAEEAAAAWRSLLELLPGRADLLNDAGLAALGRGDAARARELFEEAVRLPGSEDARENLAWLLLREEPPAVAAATEHFDAVLAEEPHRDRALYGRFRARRMR